MPIMTDDLEQIRLLKARFLRLLDSKEWTDFELLLTPDATFDFPGPTGERQHMQGAAEFVAMLRTNLADRVTVHHGHMPEITFDSEDRASGVWAMEDKLWFGPDSPIEHVHGYGHYHETYVRTPEGWRIASFRLTRLRYDVVTAPVGPTDDRIAP